MDLLKYIDLASGPQRTLVCKNEPGVPGKQHRMTVGFRSGPRASDLACALSGFSRRRGGCKMQHVEPLAIRLVPIKLALVVLRAERRKEPLRLRAALYDGPRLHARLARGTLSVDALLRGWREERADTAEGQADARAALRGLFRALWPLVRVHAVHPARVGLEAHDEERVVRQRHALRAPLRRSSCSCSFSVIVVVGRGVQGVFLRLECHGAPRAKREVHDARVAHDVDRLV